jgi:hypothetical protein
MIAFMAGRLIARVAVGGCAAVGLSFWVMAAMRPYADNQRNWLVLLGAACVSVAVLLALLAWVALRRAVAARLRAGANRFVAEWRRR